MLVSKAAPAFLSPLNDVRLNKTDVNVIEKITKIDFHSKGNEVSLKKLFCPYRTDSSTLHI